MGKYEDYLVRLRKEEGGLDAERMRRGINSRIGRSSRYRSVGGGLLMVFILSSLVYVISGLYLSGGGELLADYVIERESPNGDAIMNYVLTE